MKPEDVPEELVVAAMAAYSDNEWRTSVSAFRAALAAVIPLIEAREREACAAALEDRIREIQRNIDDNIAEVRVVEMTPADNRPLIKARDWLRDVLAAIRARGERT